MDPHSATEARLATGGELTQEMINKSWDRLFADVIGSHVERPADFASEPEPEMFDADASKVVSRNE